MSYPDYPDPEKNSTNDLIEDVLIQLERTSAGHAIGADKAETPYAKGFSKGFDECLLLFKKLLLKEGN